MALICLGSGCASQPAAKWTLRYIPSVPGQGPRCTGNIHIYLLQSSSGYAVVAESTLPSIAREGERFSATAPLEPNTVIRVHDDGARRDIDLLVLFKTESPQAATVHADAACTAPQ